jgi:DNA invertase Pin-like site-specific DNA recombinase
MPKLTSKVAIYARSNLPPGSFESRKAISAQIDKCLAFALSEGWSRENIVIFYEEGVSGVAHKSPILDDLVGQLSVMRSVIVAELSRLTRSAERLHHVTAAMRNARVELWDSSEGDRLFPPSKANLAAFRRAVKIVRKITK